MNDIKKGASPDVFRILALIFVFWAVMTMAISIPFVNLGPEEKAPDVKTGGISDGGASAASSSDYIRTLWMMLIALLAAMFVIYTVMAALKKDKEHFKGLFATLIGVTLMVGFILGMAYLSQSGALDGAIRGLIGGGTGDSGTAGNGSASSDVVTHQETTAFYAVIMMVLFLVGAVVYMMVGSLMSKKIEKAPSQTEELMEKIENAMRDLKEGKKVHEVILQAYEQMCRILAKSGVKGEDSLTPREFRNAVIKETGIRGEPIERLTELFEEARYSTHPIDDSKRRDAIRALRELKQEMERHELEESGGNGA